MSADGFPLGKAACSQLHTNKTGLLPGQGRILVQSKLELDKWTCKKKNEKPSGMFPRRKVFVSTLADRGALCSSSERSNPPEIFETKKKTHKPNQEHKHNQEHRHLV
jgi:hypothetical protein